MGRVLFVSNCTLSYYGFKLVEELRRRLVCAGYSLETTSFCEVGGYARDLGAMELALRQPFTFAVVLSESTEVLNRLDRSGIPFVVISERHFRLNSHPGWVCFHVAAAVPKFVRQCSSAGIRRVCEFGYVRRMSASAASQLRNVGIRVEQILVDVNYGRGILEGIVRGSMEAAFERFGRKGVALPDLIYLPDDYLARGVLTALQELGIRAPQDVRIVSFANAGLGPVYPRELTRMQMNPILDGKILAEEILRAIAGDTVDWKCIAPQYVIGETFAQP